jgi:DNA-binding MarR family transcriptional regulator
LNELRVLTAVATACSRGEGTSVSQIADECAISRATVSRLITHWSAQGQIVESQHPDDGRRRILGFSDEAFRLNEQWAKELGEVFSENGLSADSI